ncbi:MAG TPA: hypothetical protein VJA40_02110 [archaeon]|nr:hypothetical protein [archaeon]
MVVICGEVKNLPYPPPGQSHLGSGLLHIHNEPEHYIHQEGRLNVSDPSKLGSFFDNIGVKFSSTELWDKKNGDVCENTGLPGKVVFKVNGVESNLYRNAPVFDGDRFEVRFE